MYITELYNYTGLVGIDPRLDTGINQRHKGDKTIQ